MAVPCTTMRCMREDSGGFCFALCCHFRLLCLWFEAAEVYFRGFFVSLYLWLVVVPQGSSGGQCPYAAGEEHLDVCGYFCQREPGPPEHPKGVQQELGCGWNGLASAQGFAGAQWHMWPLPHPPVVCDSGLPCPVLGTFAQST